MPQLKMLENVLKPKETDTVMLENTFLEDWDEIGTKMAKKGHLLHKSGINSELVSIQRVKKGIIFTPVCIVFSVWSLDRIPKLYQLKLQCVNDQMFDGKHLIY